MTLAQVAPALRLAGDVRVPGDKSASHRALLLSALADGVSTIEGLSPGHDVRGTSDIVVQLGAERVDEDRLVTVRGPSSGLRASAEALDCGNSGTTMRLLAGVVSGIEGVHRLVGDPSLSKRPMDRVATPLRMMGSKVEGQGERLLAPLLVEGSSTLSAIDYDVPIPSAQVKSAVLLAGLFAQGHTVVGESNRTRTTTEDMLLLAGVEVRSVNLAEGRVVTLLPSRPQARHWTVPADPSQAAFFCTLGLLHPDAVLRVVDVEDAPERIGFLGVLERMGGDIRRHVAPAGVTIEVRSSSLTATEIHSREIPSVDEAPILTIAAAAATGVTAFRDMGELRVKESDRFAGSMEMAALVGARVWSEGDDYFVEGLGSASAFASFEIDAGLDHRIVMSSAVAGAAGQGCRIHGADTVSSSYPHFFDDLDGLR